jgi:hypothetical protein
MRTVTTAVVLALVLGGAIARFAERENTFFGDEMWVLEFVGNGRYVPHAVPQPPLFFFSAVAASRICGMGEACLRAPAEIAALLLTLVPLLVWRTTRMLRPVGVIVWTAILAFSSPVSFYAARVKQYPLEALGCAVLLWLFMRACEDERRWTPFAVVAGVLVATLHAPVFLLAGTGLGVLVIARTPRQRVKLVAMHIGLAAIFAIAYFAYVRPGPEVERYFGNLADYFTTELPAFWDGSASFVVSQTRLWLGQFLNVTPGFTPALVLAVLVWGVHVAWRRDRESGAIAIAAFAPVLFVLLASAARQYPYGEVRLMIFLLPGISLAFALAVQWIVSQRRIVAVPAVAAVLVLLAIFVVHGVRDDSYNASYMRIDDLRRAYTYLKARRQPGTPVVVFAFNARPLQHYVPIASRDLVSLHPATREVTVPAAEFWTFLSAADRVRVLPEGAVVAEEMRDGQMRLVRYRRLQ